MSAGHHHSHHHHHHAGGMPPALLRIGLASLGVAAGVIAFKYLAYWLSGSVALFSDVLESITHVITAGITLLALRVSHQPADRDHPYGHQKAEYFSAIVEALFIAIAAAMVLYEAVPRLWAPQMPDFSVWVIATTVLATVLNGGWAIYLLRHARVADSPALAADGWHLLTDVATSLGVLVGIALALYTGWAIIDPLIACVVAGHILWAGWHVMGGALSSLMDKSASKAVEAHIREVVAEHCGGQMLELHALKTRVSGRVTFIEFHLVVKGDMSVKASHGICDKVEKALTEHIKGAQVTIHVEPEGTKH